MSDVTKVSLHGFVARPMSTSPRVVGPVQSAMGVEVRTNEMVPVPQQVMQGRQADPFIAGTQNGFPRAESFIPGRPQTIAASFAVDVSGPGQSGARLSGLAGAFLPGSTFARPTVVGVSKQLDAPKLTIDAGRPLEVTQYTRPMPAKTVYPEVRTVRTPPRTPGAFARGQRQNLSGLAGKLFTIPGLNWDVTTDDLKDGFSTLKDLIGGSSSTDAGAERRKLLMDSVSSLSQILVPWADAHPSNTCMQGVKAKLVEAAKHLAEWEQDKNQAAHDQPATDAINSIMNWERGITWCQVKGEACWGDAREPESCRRAGGGGETSSAAKEDNTLLYVGIAAVAFLALGGGGYALTRGGKKG